MQRRAADDYGFTVSHQPQLWQTVINQHWPLHDRQGAHARGIPDRTPIPVRVRLEWERDGEQWLDGQATRWTRDSVYVQLDDPRLRVNGVWVRPGDVRRR